MTQTHSELNPEAALRTSDVQADSPWDLIALDDDVLVLELIKRQLRRENIQLFTALEPADALVQIQQQDPRFLLIDYQMPLCDGLSFLTQCQQQCLLASTQIFAMSTLPPPSEVEIQFLQLGVKLMHKDRLLENNYLAQLVGI